jgi:hypothetical protein
MKKTVLTVNIHEAKTQLSKLVDQAVKADPFVIAKTASSSHRRWSKAFFCSPWIR